MNDYYCKECLRRSAVKNQIVEETVDRIKSFPWWVRLFNKFEL